MENYRLDPIRYRGFLEGVMQMVDGQMAPEESVYLSSNLDYNKVLGRACVRKGTEAITKVTGEGEVRKLYEFIESDGSKNLLAVRGDSVKHYSGGSWITSTTVSEESINFTTFLNGVLLLDGVQPKFSTDLSSWTTSGGRLNIDLVPSDAKIATEFLSQIYVAGMEDNPDRLRFSSTPVGDSVENAKVDWYLYEPRLTDKVSTFGLDFDVERGVDEEGDWDEIEGNFRVKFNPLTYDEDIDAWEFKFRDDDPYWRGYLDKDNIYRTYDSVDEVYIVSMRVKDDDGNIITISGREEAKKILRIAPTGAGFIDIKPADGSGKITALQRVPGYVLIFKDRALYRWDSQSIGVDDMIDVGTISQKTTAKLDGMVYFLNQNGVYRTDGGRPQKISRRIEDIIKSVENFDEVNMIGDDNRVYVNFGEFEVDGYYFNNLVAIFNTDTETWTLYDYPFDIKSFSKYNLDGMTEVSTIGSDGLVRVLERGDYDIEEEVYELNVIEPVENIEITTDGENIIINGTHQEINEDYYYEVFFVGVGGQGFEGESPEFEMSIRGDDFPIGEEIEVEHTILDPDDDWAVVEEYTGKILIEGRDKNTISWMMQLHEEDFGIRSRVKRIGEIVVSMNDMMEGHIVISTDNSQFREYGRLKGLINSIQKPINARWFKVRIVGRGVSGEVLSVEYPEVYLTQNREI